MKNRIVYTTRNELGAIRPHPDIASVFLPPQPSILAAPKGPIVFRFASKVDSLSHKLGPVRPFLAKMKRVTKRVMTRKSISKLIREISFKVEEAPTVSIVIPVFNKFELTYSCLKSIQDNVSGNVTYEVIIVDNNSTDKSHHLKNMSGLIYVKNKENLGFVEACNIGAAKGTGSYLVFLNNDALVTPNWLESLLSTIKSSPNIGLVGSKILYPDGRLQEAGGMIFKDGSGWNYGKNDHPDRYQYNYVREVDYCSGASIIIGSKLFESFGGFDMLYAPAYYEDTDLAFKVRQVGLSVIYQPESVIYHIEGATAGTSTGGGFKKYQAINHKKFLKRWNKTLQSDHMVEEDVYLARDRTHTKMALLLDEFIPMPDKDSGSVRAMRMIELLQELDYKVTFFSNHLQKIEGYTQKLQQMGVEVVYGPTTFTNFIEEYGKFYDIVMLSRPRIGAYFIELCQAYCTKAKIIYDTVDLHFLRLRRQAQYETGEMKTYYEKAADKHEIIEKDLMETADNTLVVSQLEADMLRKDGIENVEVVSNIHVIDLDAYKSVFKDRKDLLFIGGYAHLPNIDGIKWFVDDIFPIVSKQIPGIKIHVVGSNMPEDLKQYLSKRKGVIVDGFLEDISPLLTKSRVFVAPLRYGAGVKGKVGQAIEFGVPVVSTTIGAEGMNLKNGTSIALADTPEAFAQSIIDLYFDQKKWAKTQLAAREVINTYFSRESAKKHLEAILK
jgi:GT2 family glycosyltransferase/glycosyltransferase involved in cell wall biosynthesis